MDFSSSFISQEEFNHFHAIDRELYALLVINLWRDPLESMQIIALWIWLERRGFNNIVKKMLSFPYILINEIAEEAVTCLNCITNNDHLFSLSSESNNDIPLIQSLMEKEISLQFFHENRLRASQEVAKIVKDICIRALTDIMQQAIQRNAAQNLTEGILSPAIFNQSALVHPACFSPMVQLPWTQENGQVPPDDRTMFVTFSKGYPVFEWEVREFFIRSYGDCIESLYMQEVQPHEQSLFARIVFHTPSIIEVILKGTGKAKFTINGKHVWARKFVPKRTKSSLPSLPLPVAVPPQLPYLPEFI